MFSEISDADVSDSFILTYQKDIWTSYRMFKKESYKLGFVSFNAGILPPTQMHILRTQNLEGLTQFCSNLAA